MSFYGFNAFSAAFVGQIIIRILSYPPEEEMASAFDRRFFLLHDFPGAEIKTDSVIIAAAGQSQNKPDTN